ncbi:hypothetical protein GOD21_12835 [Sinorhizobium medicae]|uniref:hypothetical protein n=1 Tax=Rhizobium meliloti TaxID=382 RepID=UPI000FD973FC|nr:hypothetical protein [Sinorhizobium meliloti]MDX0657906.1 hypothetical protein [Sinorhizobium medicae]
MSRPQRPEQSVRPIKVYFKDLLNMGLVKSRYDLHMKIKAGRLRAPHKEGESMQATAWWYYDDLLADAAAERRELESAQK